MVLERYGSDPEFRSVVGWCTINMPLSLMGYPDYPAEFGSAALLYRAWLTP